MQYSPTGEFATPAPDAARKNDVSDAEKTAK